MNQTQVSTGFPQQGKAYVEPSRGGNALQFASVLILSQLFSAATLANHSFSPYLALIADISQVLAGGVQRKDSHRMLLDIGAEYQHQQHLLFVNYQLQRGPNGSDNVGDIQAYSNIDEDNFNRIYQFYYQYQGDDWFARVGQTDANAEFAVAEPAANFINSSMGFSPTIMAFPTYPLPAQSISAGITVTDRLDLSAGLFASRRHDDFAEQFYVAELRYALSATHQLKFGLWHDTNTYQHLEDTSKTSGSTGYYLIVQGQQHSINWLDSQQLSWYTQLGKADADVSEIEWHIGSGFELQHPFAQPQHALGLGISYVRLSQYIDSDSGHETALESYYLWPLSENLALKPDLQYILSPSGSEQLDNAWVFTLRLEINF